MGMFDTVVVLDPRLECAEGHRIGDLQTKELDEPSMDTWLVSGGRLFRLESGRDTERWVVEESRAMRVVDHAMQPEEKPRVFKAYTHCSTCDPVLVRDGGGRGSLFGDLVREHQVWVEFRMEVQPGGALHIVRLPGDRAALAAELRTTGLRVLDDAEPLAVAHREIRAARATLSAHGRWSHW